MAYRYDRVTYTYDRRKVASKNSILNLIVKGVLAERNVTSLVDAYIDAVKDDFEEEYGTPPESFSDDRWLDTHGILKADAAERIAQKIYFREYKRRARWSDPAEVFEWPEVQGRGKRTPKDVAEAVAYALAIRDGAEAKELRERAMAGPPHPPNRFSPRRP